MRFKLLAVLLLISLLTGCVMVEYRSISVAREYWLASRYLEAGKEPPQNLTVETKMVPPSIWLAAIQMVTTLVPKILKYRWRMYRERTIIIYWKNPQAEASCGQF